MAIEKLQNGSDIRGISLRENAEDITNLHEEEAFALTYGFLRLLSSKLDKPVNELKVCIAMDSRITGPMLAYAVECCGFFAGAQILNAGLGSTPAVFFSTRLEGIECDGGIMITASHLPWNRNGFKYFFGEGGLDKQDIAEIISIAEIFLKENDVSELYDSVAEKYKGKPLFKISDDDFNMDCGHSDADRKNNLKALSQKVYSSSDHDFPLMKRYSEMLRQIIIDEITKLKPGIKPEQVLSNLKIVVDAGNGAGGFFAKDVLLPLGADISASCFLEPDGLFPNHPPNPENSKAMASISAAVKNSGADLGLIFDTDVDRASAVSSDGSPISRNSIIALCAKMLGESAKGSTVVTDSITGDELSVFLEEVLELKHLRYKRGYKNVINKAKELNEAGTDCRLAIETSGHGAFRENFFLDDGAYIATRIVIEAALLKERGLHIDSLIEELRHPEEAVEIRLPITLTDFSDYADQVLNAFKNWCKENEDFSIVEPNYEGIRVNFTVKGGKGWFLLRKSLHDPILPLNIESSVRGGLAAMVPLLKEFFSNMEYIDHSKLKI